MLNQRQIEKMESQGRSVSLAKTGDEELAVFKLLPGTWKNTPNLPGRGWNMIALPFMDPSSKLNYRLLVNQYNEELTFSLIDKGVPNRGIMDGANSDQFVVTLDYQQQINQVAADDFPVSGKTGNDTPNLAIHHEPGLFLQMANHSTDGLEIARLSSIPHGNSVFALGKVTVFDGAPTIPDENGLPIGVSQDLESGYLSPYKHYNEKLFKGVFNPVHPNDLLKQANEGVNIVRTTELKFDTKFGTGGINNIPFIEKQADASEMQATFWIQELAEKDVNGEPKLRIQYTQTVFLDFFPRHDGEPGKIRWPHVSINTMEKEVVQK